jgi:Bacterial regulatory proteins, lacI family
MASDDTPSQSRGGRRAGVAAQPTSAKRRTRRDDRAVTLANVGKLVGVSDSTVSRVVNNSLPVSPVLPAIVA